MPRATLARKSWIDGINAVSSHCRQWSSLMLPCLVNLTEETWKSMLLLLDCLWYVGCTYCSIRCSVKRLELTSSATRSPPLTCSLILLTYKTFPRNWQSVLTKIKCAWHMIMWWIRMCSVSSKLRHHLTFPMPPKIITRCSHLCPG
jgi:hypothetical protein